MRDIPTAVESGKLHSCFPRAIAARFNCPPSLRFVPASRGQWLGLANSRSTPTVPSQWSLRARTTADGGRESNLQRAFTTKRTNWRKNYARYCVRSRDAGLLQKSFLHAQEADARVAGLSSAAECWSRYTVVFPWVRKIEAGACGLISPSKQASTALALRASGTMQAVRQKDLSPGADGRN